MLKGPASDFFYKRFTMSDIQWVWEIVPGDGPDVKLFVGWVG